MLRYCINPVSYTHLDVYKRQGWASGPAPFLCEYVLGIRPIKAGCKQVLVAPDLGGLDYVKGSYPTPYGIIYVEHRRLDNGEIDTKVSAPDEIEIIMG